MIESNVISQQLLFCVRTLNVLGDFVFLTSALNVIYQYEVLVFFAVFVSVCMVYFYGSTSAIYIGSPDSDTTDEQPPKIH